MSKIVLISTSPRGRGNTVCVLNEMAETIRENGSEATVLSFAGKTVNGCRACGGCKGTGVCRLGDDFNDLLAEVKAADGMIIGAPVYFGTARGDCMNFLQRLGMVSLSNGRFLRDKVGGPVAVGRRGGHTATLSEMLMFFFINGMIVPGADYWNMGFGREPGQVLEDEEGMANFRLFAANVCRLAAKMKD